MSKWSQSSSEGAMRSGTRAGTAAANRTGVSGSDARVAAKCSRRTTQARAGRRHTFCACSVMHSRIASAARARSPLQPACFCDTACEAGTKSAARRERRGSFEC